MSNKEMRTDGRLAGRRAVVTGGASGIGFATTRRFLNEGARVTIWDVRPDAVEEAVGTLRAEGHGDNVQGVAVDVSSADSVAAAANTTLGFFPEGVTVIINNAGVLDDYATVLDTSEALWDRTMNVNLKGMFLVTKALLPSMLEAGGGAIVCTASIAGFIAGGGGIAYTSSKHGVVGFVKQMASDYAQHGVRVNAVAPGATATGMTVDILDNEELDVVQALRGAPAGRYSQPEELANVILFLASDEASFVHGATYQVDGGWTIR